MGLIRRLRETNKSIIPGVVFRLAVVWFIAGFPALGTPSRFKNDRLSSKGRQMAYLSGSYGGLIPRHKSATIKYSFKILIPVF
jgi:hypothetical protein